VVGATEVAVTAAATEVPATKVVATVATVVVVKVAAAMAAAIAAAMAAATVARGDQLGSYLIRLIDKLTEYESPLGMAQFLDNCVRE